jgi:regulator of RNase E activity RraA
MAVDTGLPVSCGGVAICPGDIIVADAEGVVCVPAHLAAAVAEVGLAMDHIEGYVQRRLANGEPLEGLYPPRDRVRKDFEKWVADGEPDF